MSGGTASGRRQAIQAGACGPGSACAGRGRRSLGNALTRMQPRCDRSMSGYDKDLAGWMPRLIAVWRKARRASPGPPDRLTPAELREVAAAVRKLSLGLTRERALAGTRYMDDPKLLGAYLLFYWPVSYAQARQVMGELPHRPRAALDLGSGPASVAFAALDAGAAEVTAADRSKAALELASQLAAEAGEALAVRQWDPLSRRGLPEGEFDLIALGHVLNELFGADDGALSRRAALVEEALGRVRRGGGGGIP